MTLDALAALRLRFVERTRRERAELADWQARGRPASSEAERLIHNLAGAAGAFGFPDLNAAAARIDDAFAEGRRPSESDVADLIREVDRLP